MTVPIVGLVPDAGERERVAHMAAVATAVELIRSGVAAAARRPLALW